MKSKKHFYAKISHGHFANGAIIQCSKNELLIVLNNNCKDPWWKKALRKIGFKIPNYEGHTKLAPYVK